MNGRGRTKRCTQKMNRDPHRREAILTGQPKENKIYLKISLLAYLDQCSFIPSD